ncbi:MAG: DUF3426 domain-containing protein [Gammaproteobacteria bacterium HGW-Gammaproteobacteria-3]|nr:MAG: DUF3426 domain-containing protein [Gammaproteobacteria bacterium HGW-Gammaproteobacteria-3]
MYTQCPHCNRTQTLGVEQLRESRGIIRCPNCSALFDALQRLSESTPGKIPPEETVGQPWAAESASASSAYWGLAVLLGFFVLIGQLIYFESSAALQNETLRPWLDKACRSLGCSLPEYRNPAYFAVIESSLTVAEGGYYSFQAVIHNQAAFPQRPPNLDLTFIRLGGEPFAARIFRPDDYREAPDAVIESDQSLTIALDIIAPDIILGGYIFELI